MEIRDNLTQHINTLPGHLVKQVLLQWASTSDFSIRSLDKALAEQQEQRNDSDHYSSTALQEDEEAWQSYVETGNCCDHSVVSTWLDTWGTANSMMPCSIPSTQQFGFSPL